MQWEKKCTPYFYDHQQFFQFILKQIYFQDSKNSCLQYYLYEQKNDLKSKTIAFHALFIFIIQNNKYISNKKPRFLRYLSTKEENAIKQLKDNCMQLYIVHQIKKILIKLPYFNYENILKGQLQKIMNYFVDMNFPFSFNSNFSYIDPLRYVMPIIAVQKNTQEEKPKNQNQNSDQSNICYENLRKSSCWLQYAFQNNLICSSKVDSQIQQIKAVLKQTENQIQESKSTETNSLKVVYQTKNSQQSQNEEKWNDQQQEKLIELVNLYGKKWKQINTQLPNKTVKQIRYHYERFLKKDRNSSWKESEDLKIVHLVNEFGRAWCKIQKHMRLRTANNIKNRFYGYILRENKYINMLNEVQFKNKGKKLQFQFEVLN